VAWSLRDTARCLEAEEELKTLPNTEDTDDVFYDLVLVIERDEEKARKALYHKVLNRRWAQTEGAGYV